MSNNDPNPKSPTETGNNEDLPTLRIRIVPPIPGLEARLDFNFNAVDETGVLWILRFTMDPNVRLSAMPPIAFFDGYSPIIPSSAWLRIGLAEGANPFILVIIHPAAGSYPHTADLLASLVINPNTMSALQVVLEDQDWPLQAPIGDPKQSSSRLPSVSFSKIPNDLILTSTGVRLNHLEASCTGTTAQALEDERISLFDANHFTGGKIPTVKKSCQI